MPTSPAASTTRDSSNLRIRPLKPMPSAPMRRSSGRKTSLKKISWVGIARWPSLWSLLPTVKPSSPSSTMKAVMPLLRVPGATVAKTM